MKLIMNRSLTFVDSQVQSFGPGKRCILTRQDDLQLRVWADAIIRELGALMDVSLGGGKVIH